MNLCINARDAVSTHGSIKVKLYEQSLESAQCDSCQQNFSGDYVVLSVSDTGHGISAEMLERIFEPFFTSKDVGAGTGMGLSMVHGIVHHHHGHIVVHSKVDVGTDFQVFFPKINNTEDDTSAMDKMGKTILVVDDEESVARFLEALLKNSGYQVIIQTDSHSALKYFKNNAEQIDLVFTDQTMPRMSGLEMAKEILTIKPDLPIILATGYSLDANEDVVLQAGVRASLKKPFNTKELLEKIESLIG